MLLSHQADCLELPRTGSLESPPLPFNRSQVPQTITRDDDECCVLKVTSGWPPAQSILEIKAFVSCSFNGWFFSGQSSMGTVKYVLHLTIFFNHVVGERSRQNGTEGPLNTLSETC